MSSQAEHSEIQSKLQSIIQNASEEISSQFQVKAMQCFELSNLEEFDLCSERFTKSHQVAIREFSLRSRFLMNEFSYCMRMNEGRDKCLAKANDGARLIVRDLNALVE